MYFQSHAVQLVLSHAVQLVLSHAMLYHCYHAISQSSIHSPRHPICRFNSQVSTTSNLRISHQLLSTWGNKPFMLLMCLIPIAVLFRLQLIRQLIQNRGDQLFFALLIIRVPVPDGDLNCVPADAVGESTDVVVECYNQASASHITIWR
jgi:hypothetical protein